MLRMPHAALMLLNSCCSCSCCSCPCCCLLCCAAGEVGEEYSCCRCSCSCCSCSCCYLLCCAAGEIGEEYEERRAGEQPFDDLMGLVEQIVPYDMTHNAGGLCMKRFGQTDQDV